jgi:hypothetical protein
VAETTYGEEDKPGEAASILKRTLARSPVADAHQAFDSNLSLRPAEVKKAEAISFGRGAPRESERQILLVDMRKMGHA